MAVTVDGPPPPPETARRGLLRYNSPLAQVSLLGLICFCCPGMFNALSGLGGGGQVDHSTADNANTALYSCFAVFGILGGGAHNLLGPRLTLLIGALTYPLYAGSFLYYNHNSSSQVFPVTAGALLGAGAGFLWAAQGAIMTSYPPPNRRGTYISLFWCLFNLVLPAAWASNFFYTYQFNNVNGKLFTLRTKGLNNVFYWGAQMVGSAGIGYFLDFGFASRRKRGLFGVVAVAVLGTAIWGGGLANQLWFNPLPKDEHGNLADPIDFRNHRYAGPFVLYFSYGLLDAMFQSLIYWIIGALANESQILSRYVGFYKGVQSAGAAVAWQIDNHNVSLTTQLIVNWGLMTISYPLLALLVFLAVKDEDNSVSSVEDGKEKDSKLSAPTSFH